MEKIIRVAQILVLLLFGIHYSQAQSPNRSESIIKYDLKTYKTDKAIPFDHPFTLTVEKLPSKRIDSIEVFQVKFKDGQRLDKISSVDSLGTSVSRAVVDMYLNHNSKSDTLQIYFPSLKPNVSFDTNVIYYLSENCQRELLKVNRILELAYDARYTHGDENAYSEYFKSASKAYNSFKKCTIDQTDNQYMSVKFIEYEELYLYRIVEDFVKSENTDTYKTASALTQNQVMAIGKGLRFNENFKDRFILLEIEKSGVWDEIQKGIIDVKKVQSLNEFDPDEFTLFERQKNLKSNLKYFDDLLVAVDEIILRGNDIIYVAGANVNMIVVRDDLLAIREKIFNNAKEVKSLLTSITKALDKNEGMRQSVYLSGSTSQNNLKTESGNIIFLDVGLACLAVRKLDNHIEPIPKLYWGISIYFRPIDKNTRKGDFYSKFDPKKVKGFDPDRKQFGPDYGVATNWTIMQHLCLNIGITMGSMTNKEFDNFYSNSSLLIGPALRFERAFKVSAGLALVRRSSENPVVSEKKIVAGCYVSLSADVDFIGIIKDMIGKL